jgi:hypothetical protein
MSSDTRTEIVYPGHPITIAYQISQAFSCFEEADAPTSFGWPRALGAEAVKGAGDCVYAAMDFLRLLHRGATFDFAVTRARAEWALTATGVYEDRLQQGDEQATQLLSLFDPQWWVPRESGAILDETRMYRYRLWRDCGIEVMRKIAPSRVRDVEGSGTCAFLMLNPSTADEIENDNTIHKCMKYAHSWGYRRLVVVNLFGYRTRDPLELEAVKSREKAVGRDNDVFIDQLFWGDDWKADLVVAAWGGHGKHLDRDHVVLHRLRERPLYYLKLSSGKRKSPYHPLYLPDATTPTLWSRT